MSRAVEIGRVTGTGQHPRSTYRWRIVLTAETSVFRPEVLVFTGYRSDSASGVSQRMRVVKPPYLKWATGYRLRRFGMVRVVVLQDRIWRRAIG